MSNNLILLLMDSPAAVTRKQVAKATFELPDGSALAMDTGQAWTIFTGTFQVTGGKAVPTSYASNLGLAWFNSAKSDVYYSADITWQNSATTRLLFRLTDNNNYLYIDIGASAVGLKKLAIGASTTAGTFPWTPVNNQVYHVEIQAFGSNIKVLLDNVLILQTDETFNQTATKMGIGRSNGTASYAAAWDNLLVEEN